MDKKASSESSGEYLIIDAILLCKKLNVAPSLFGFVYFRSFGLSTITSHPFLHLRPSNAWVGPWYLTPLERFALLGGKYPAFLADRYIERSSSEGTKNPQPHCRTGQLEHRGSECRFHGHCTK